MKQHILKLPPFIAAAALVVPAIASAVGILDTIVVVNRILGAIVPLLITVALIVFIWGLITYLTKVGTEDKNKGLRYLLKALRMLRDEVSFHLTVVQRPGSQEAPRLVKELGIDGRVTFLPSGAGATALLESNSPWDFHPWVGRKSGLPIADKRLT